MSIERLPSGKYRVKVYMGEGRPRLTRTFTRRPDARAWERKMLTARERGEDPRAAETAGQTLAELALEHMRTVAPDLAPATRALYRNLWAAHVDPSVAGRDGGAHPIATMPVASITAEDIEGLRTDLQDRTGPVATRRVLMLVQTILDRAVRYGRIPSNPARLVRKPSRARTRAVRPISPADVERLRARLTGADALMVSVLAYAGLRPQEACELRWRDVGARSLAIHAPKTGRDRAVRLLAPLAADLKAWREASGGKDGDPIFARADGDPWSPNDFKHFRTRRFAKAVRDTGVDIGRPYDLRHSAASLWLHEGKSPIQVAAWMGHSPSMLMETYAWVLGDLDPDDRQSAEDIIAAAREAAASDRGTAVARDPVHAGAPQAN